MSCVLACDLGGTSLRAGLVERSGRILAIETIAGTVYQGDSGWAEVEPASWWSGLVAAAGALAAREPAAFAAVEAIAISAITRTQVFLGRDGQLLRAAILWHDTRASARVPALLARCPPGHPETPELGAFHPLARLWWLAQEEPATARALARVVDPKDYLNLRLTGVAASDPISMARLAAAARPGPDGRSLLSAAGIDPGVVPLLVDPESIVGSVLPGLDGAFARLAGRPVLAMANDTWASVIGLGAMRPGYAYNLSGTTEVLGVVSAAPARAEGLLSVEWGPALHQLGGPSQNGADALAWLVSLADPGLKGLMPLAGPGPEGRMPVGAALSALLEQPRDADPLLFLPFLRGERVPYWDPLLRGAFIGLNRRHKLVDLAWAVMEGIACLNREVLERAEAGSGRAVREVRFGGGGATNHAWCQVKADVLDRPVVTTDLDEHGLLGAAIVAFTALGGHASLDAAQEALVRPARRFDPAPERRASCDRLYRLFRQAGDALRPVSRELAEWNRQAGSRARP